MPRADVGDESTSMTGGKKGEFQVKYAGIADKTMKPRDPDSDFPESLRVQFALVGKENESVSLGVAIEDPAPDLWGFVADPNGAPAGDEAALRLYVDRNVERGPVWVYVRDNFVRSRLATEGSHVFEKIIGIWRYANNEGVRRLGMTAITADGLTTTWNCKEPQLKKTKGQKGPEDDYIGGDAELNPNQYAFQYLQAFGLDWERMKQEDLREAEAYWPGHIGDDMRPIEPLFPDIENPWPGFLAMVDRHGWNPVKMEIVRHETYGLGPKRTGQFPIVKMTPVERVGGGESAEFEREKALFLELWDNLTKAVLSQDDARFLVGTQLSDAGRAVALATLVPLVHEWPDAVTRKKADGSPAIQVPPTEDAWNLNGVVAANLTAERLLKAGPDVLFELIALGDPASSGVRVVAWAKEHVPEWAGAGYSEEGETL